MNKPPTNTQAVDYVIPSCISVEEYMQHLRKTCFKTKMCSRIESDTCCHNGNFCPFAHSLDEIRPLPNFRKTKLCNSYTETKWCQAGDACCFAHGEHELRVPNASNSQFTSTKTQANRSSVEPSQKHAGHSRTNKISPGTLSDYAQSLQCLNWNGSLEELRCVLNMLYENANLTKKIEKPTVESSFEQTNGDTQSERNSTELAENNKVKFKKTRRGKRGGRNKNRYLKNQDNISENQSIKSYSHSDTVTQSTPINNTSIQNNNAVNSQNLNVHIHTRAQVEPNEKLNFKNKINEIKNLPAYNDDLNDDDLFEFLKNMKHEYHSNTNLPSHKSHSEYQNETSFSTLTYDPFENLCLEFQNKISLNPDNSQSKDNLKPATSAISRNFYENTYFPDLSSTNDLKDNGLGEHTPSIPQEQVFSYESNSMNSIFELKNSSLFNNLTSSGIQNKPNQSWETNISIPTTDNSTQNLFTPKYFHNLTDHDMIEYLEFLKNTQSHKADLSLLKNDGGIPVIEKFSDNQHYSTPPLFDPWKDIFFELAKNSTLQQDEKPYVSTFTHSSNNVTNIEYKPDDPTFNLISNSQFIQESAEVAPRIPIVQENASETSRIPIINGDENNKHIHPDREFNKKNSRYLPRDNLIQFPQPNQFWENEIIPTQSKDEINQNMFSFYRDDLNDYDLFESLASMNNIHTQNNLHQFFDNTIHDDLTPLPTYDHWKDVFFELSNGTTTRDNNLDEIYKKSNVSSIPFDGYNLDSTNMTGISSSNLVTENDFDEKSTFAMIQLQEKDIDNTHHLTNSYRELVR